MCSRSERTVFLGKCIIGLWLLSFQNDFAFGCGGITHTIIAERAKDSFQENSHYRKLMDIHEDAFNGGAPYPDAFYDDICFKGIYHDVSEDTHWGEFLNVSINYINKLPKPWDPATEKLFVFVMALMSHQVADITWHSMYLEQGFLHTMGYMNFHGSYSNAHPVGDFGNHPFLLIVQIIFKTDSHNYAGMHDIFYNSTMLVHVYMILVRNDLKEVMFGMCMDYCQKTTRLTQINTGMCLLMISTIFTRNSMGKQGLTKTP